MPITNTADINDEPTVNHPGGYKAWLDNNDDWHRNNGPARIFPSGSEHWHRHGLYHREDGPAVTNSDGYQAWYQNGLRHRTDGPAIIDPDGTEEYWLNGEQVDIIVHFLQRK